MKIEISDENAVAMIREEMTLFSIVLGRQKLQFIKKWQTLLRAIEIDILSNKDLAQEEENSNE